MRSDIILSICIPTYNRATYLEGCLQSIVKQAGNNPEVEVLISDNVSDDGTQAICENYVSRYRNVKYFRNETNIGGDKNFIRVLKLGQGEYLKLINDSVEFAEGGVLKMLEIVKRHVETREVVFFANGHSHLRHVELHYGNGLNEFLKIASFWSTWITTTGLWREDFLSIMENHQFRTKSFLQTELQFESVSIKQKFVIYTKPLIIGHEVANKKTGYNFFDVFINGYLITIIRGMWKEKKISWFAYYREKNKFFLDFLFFWYKRIKIKRNHSADITGEGMEKLVFKIYKYDPIFYLYVLFLPFYMIGYYIKKLKKKNRVI